MRNKRKDVLDSPVRSGPRRMSISVEEAENGTVIHTHGEGKNGEYTSKTHVASDGEGARRIANSHLDTFMGKKKGKKTKGKTGTRKISFAK